MLKRALTLTRRTMLGVLAFAGHAVAGRAASVRDLSLPRNRSLKALEAVRSWGCQYQNVDLAAIARSDLDLVVVDPSLDDDSGRFITAAECGALKSKQDGSRRLVLAYISVGEADTKRWYWPAAWRAARPGWVGSDNPNWPGAVSIEYWNPAWRTLICDGPDSVLNRIVRTGFDGIFLDRVDGYGDWGSSDHALKEMVKLVTALGVRARHGNPGFILLMQNAEAALLSDELVAVIDAHNKESLLTGLTGQDRRNTPDDVEWSLNHLRRLQGQGIPTFATEYVSDTRLRREVETELEALGFRPFFATLGLDRLPGAHA